MTIKAEVAALRSAAGALLRTDLRTLKVEGPDRERWLNGMLSNDVAKLGPGQGLLAIKPSNKGRIEGVVRVRATESAFFLDVQEAVAERVARNLETFIIMDDCTIGDVSSTRDVVAVYGPNASEVLESLGLGSPGLLADLAFEATSTRAVIRDGWLGVDGYEVHVEVGKGAALLARLEEAGVARLTAEAVDAVRIEAGVPLDGRDLDEDTIPLEAGLLHALSFEKGCYVGQEVIARAHNLGGVKHRLVGIELDGDVVPGREATITALDDPEKETGEITSAVRSPTLSRVIALGYVRTVHEAPGTKVEVRWGEGARATGVVRALPFVS